MRLRALLLVLLLSANALAIDSSPNTEYVKLKINIWRDVSSTAPLTYGTLTAYDLPQSSPTLGILSKTLPPNSGQKTDSFGNTYLETKWLETGTFPYQMDFTLESRAQTNTLSKPPPFPLPKGMADQAKEYLQSSYYSPITPELEAKALELTQGSKDSFEAIARIAFWLHNNIEYDAQYGPVIEKADWVLKNRKGVCDEYAHTLISMARAVGIPARYVSGIAYGKSTLAEISWQNHAWAEVYLGQWVPFDPTWGEMGYIDATHLKLAVGVDSSDLETKFEWVPDTAKMQLSEIKYSVQELEYRNFSAKPILFSSTIDSEAAGAGSSLLIESTLKNNLKGCLGDEAKLSLYSDASGNPDKSFSTAYGDSPRLLVLCPGDEKKTGWIIKTPARLDEGYNYYYDAIAYDQFTDSKMKITVDPRTADKPNLRLALDRTILTPGETAAAKVEVENNLDKTINSIRLYAGEESFEQNTRVIPASAGSAQFTIKPTKAGTTKILAYAPHNSASSQISTIASRAVAIKSAGLPETAIPGMPANASALIENTGSLEQTVKITVSLETEPVSDQYLTLKPKESKKIEIPFVIPPNTKLGSYQLSLKVALNDEKSASLLVYENKKPEIMPTEETYFSGVDLKILLNIKNKADIPLSDIKATVAGGEPIKIGALQPGAETKITYRTRFGSAGAEQIPLKLEYRNQFKSHMEEYSIPLTLTEPSLIEKIVYNIKLIITEIFYE